MVVNILKKFIGDRNTRLIRQLQGVVVRINALEPQVAALTDTAHGAKTIAFRQRLERGEAYDTQEWGGCGCFAPVAQSRMDDLLMEAAPRE